MGKALKIVFGANIEKLASFENASLIFLFQLPIYGSDKCVTELSMLVRSDKLRNSNSQSPTQHQLHGN